MKLCSLLWIVNIKQMNWWSMLWKTLFIYDNVHNHVIMNYFMTPRHRKGVSLKYRPFWEPPILQGRIHEAKLPLSGLGHNFLLECTCNKHFWTAFWKHFSGIPHLPTFHGTWHRAPGTWIFRCLVSWCPGVLCQATYFRSLVHSSRRLWPKPD